MCGISGLVDFQSSIDLSIIADMTDCIRHRGPDDEGFLFGNIETHKWAEYGGKDSYADLNLQNVPKGGVEGYQLALGNRRLAILDTSSAGHNPMSFADGKYWFTYNGEVYNYIELREELKEAGYSFYTETDTEVILAAYDHWGVDCLSRFNGMWAFALWDAKKNRLFCARDRFGIKPFYYHWDGALFAFASEIKALRVHPKIRGGANQSVLYDYLSAGSIDHRDETFFEGIKKLPQGSFLILDLTNRDVTIEKYWQLGINTELGDAASIQSEKIEEFQQLFSDAVRYRLRSDVPIGTTLSGGLDSSSIVAKVNQIMREEHLVPANVIGDKQKTFSAVFDEKDIDERRYLDLVVQATGVDGQQVQPQGKDGLWREMQIFQYHHDEPVSSSSMYAQWNVMRIAHKAGIKVLLDGQGADEVLGGYNYYLGSLMAQSAREKGISEFMRIANEASEKVQLSKKMLAGLGVYNYLPQPIAQMLMGTGNRFFRKNTTLANASLEPAFVAEHRNGSGDAKNMARPEFAKHLRESTLRHSLPALLRFEDRNSMAFSIEARVPFLDHRLVEYVFSLPAIYRVQNGWTKWILRKSMEEQLPQEVVWRRGKLGFETPEKRWLEEGRQWVQEFFNDSKGEILSREFVRETAIEKAIRGERFPGYWRLINLESWLRTFFN